MLPYGGNQSHDWWLRFDRKLLRKCDCIAVLAVEGWQDSPGVQEEIELALVLGKPVYLIREITSLEKEEDI
jgi:nucleoside 2-deoxyribosyltransferase